MAVRQDLRASTPKIRASHLQRDHKPNAYLGSLVDGTAPSTSSTPPTQERPPGPGHLHVDPWPARTSRGGILLIINRKRTTSVTGVARPGSGPRPPPTSAGEETERHLGRAGARRSSSCASPGTNPFCRRDHGRHGQRMLGTARQAEMTCSCSHRRSEGAMARGPRR